MHLRDLFTSPASRQDLPGLHLSFRFVIIFLSILFLTNPALAIVQQPLNSSANDRSDNSFLSEFEQKEIGLIQEVIQNKVPGELLVKFRRGIGHEMRQRALDRVASSIEHFQDKNSGPKGRPGPAVFDQLVHVKLKPDFTPEAAIAELERDPNV